jgi:peptide/nickel transport system permease protein
MPAFMKAILKSRAGTFGWAFLAIFVLVSILSPWIAPHDPTAANIKLRMAPPTISWSGFGKYPLGNDQLGRDVLSRLLIGSRVTLLVAGSAVLLGGIVGVLMGLVSGYFGGWPERIIMRLADIQLAFPLMILALIIVAVLGPSLRNLVLVLALTSWVRYARIVRGDVLSLREREFIMSARAVGASSRRILLKHILPNVITPAIIVGTLELARVVIMEAALSFLGLGVQPPDPSWGRMLADGRTYLASAWWLATFPGVAILLLVLSVNLAGDWMRDYFDPRLRGKR